MVECACCGLLRSLLVVANAGAAADGNGTFFLFATQLATGIAFALLFVPLRLIGRRFFVLLSFVAIVFLALAVAAEGLALNAYYLSFAALLIVYNVLLPRQAGIDVSAQRQAREGGAGTKLTSVCQLLLAAAAACGAVALVADAHRHPVALGLPLAESVWLAAQFLASALLLGSALVAMTLGHWYLVLRGLSFGPLARLTTLLAAALALRVTIAVASVVLQGERWSAFLQHGWVTFLLDPGIFVLARAIFGLVVPAALVWMIWRCVKIRSNQSATGILYVCLAFVLIGEIIAKYFLVSARLLL